LAPHFLNGNVRLFGDGEWYRVDSKWEMARFMAIDFVELDRAELRDSVNSIREVFSGLSGEDFISAMTDLRRE
jgi:hypothetical protein